MIMEEIAILVLRVFVDWKSLIEENVWYGF